MLRFDPDVLEERLEAEAGKRAERLRLEGSLIEFHKAAWEQIDPAPYVHGWHLDAIAEHLEAVTYGEIRKLLINIPPRHSKSLLASVTWPAWMWAKPADPKHPLIGAQVKFMCLSYADNLSLDLAIIMRRLVQSEWYQERWVHRVKIAPDQEAKSKFDTMAGGYRISSSFSGSVTGRGGDIKIIDDPHKAEEAQSEQTRQSVINKYNGVLKSRMTDPRHTAEVIIMQRLHQEDLSGHVLDTDDEFVHLRLPAEYDFGDIIGGRKYVSPTGWKDPREEEGELLWPDRFGPRELAPFKVNPYEWSGQWQQSPSPKGGEIFRREWWEPWEESKYPVTSYRVCCVDTAYTEKEENDPSALTVWGVFEDKAKNPKIILMAGWRKRLVLHGEEIERLPGENRKAYEARCKPHWGLVEWIMYTCEKYKVSKLIIEAKATGITVAQEIRRLAIDKRAGLMVDLYNPGRLDKVARAYAVQHLFAEGMITAPLDKAWCQTIITEMETFPKGTFDDFTDTATAALRHLRDTGMAVRREEKTIMDTERAMHRSEEIPLYDV